jgi:hypothetical protein
MYIYIYTYIYIYIHTHTHCVRVCLHAYLKYVCIYVCMVYRTTNFDLFLASEMKCVSRYRFWDAEHENGYVKS